MLRTPKQLGQTRPATTTAASIYSPASGVRTEDMQLTIVNHTASAATFRVFQDDNGTTYDETTALYWDVSLAAGSTTVVSVPPMDDATGNVGIATGTGNALTFTLNGTEISDDAVKILGQSNPASTTAASIYSPGTNVSADRLQMTIVNTTGSAKSVDVYQDDDGTTYSAVTAIYFGKAIDANSTLTVFLHPMNNSAGNVGIKNYTANACCFTLSGRER